MRKTGFACCARLGWVVFLFVVATGTGLAAFAQGPTEPPRERREFRSLLPLTAFYSTPSPLPPGRPGELIRSDEFYEYQLPEGVSASRILITLVPPVARM